MYGALFKFAIDAYFWSVKTLFVSHVQVQSFLQELNPNSAKALTIKIGKIIFYDFSRDLPQIIVNTVSSEKLPVINSDKNQNSEFWKEKYFSLLEEHLNLLKKYSEIKK